MSAGGGSKTETQAYGRHNEGKIKKIYLRNRFGFKFSDIRNQKT